jgi:YVTN family beta-propeller protein
VALPPDGRRTFTANGLAEDVSVVELPEMRVSHTLRVGTRPWGVAIVP